jgi:hypothetical protein
VQPQQLLARHRQQLERVGVAQVVLGEERDLGQLVEGRQVAFGFDACLVQTLGAQRLACDDAGDGGA